MILERYREEARRSFYAISFDPEKRGDAVIRDYSEELESDLTEIEESRKETYQASYTAKFLKWLSSQSRCMSSMITGPANFPVARNQKYMNWADNAYTEFREWRQRFFKDVNRVRTLSPEEELDNALRELDKAEYRQKYMKAVNKMLRKGETICHGFPTFSLTNNNAQIKRLREKVITMRSRIITKESFEPIPFPGGEITLDNDRVIITHDSKPEQKVIDNLKSKGFRWSRNFGAWSRKHTARAILDAKQIVGVK